MKEESDWSVDRFREVGQNVKNEAEDNPQKHVDWEQKGKERLEVVDPTDEKSYDESEV